MAASDDSLLQCLMTVCRFHGGGTTAAALCAGLPLKDGRLTPDLFERAAARVGLASKIAYQDIVNIAVARSGNGLVSNESEARFRLTEDLFRSTSTLIGRVVNASGCRVNVARAFALRQERFQILTTPSANKHLPREVAVRHD